jgi:integrase
MHDKSIELVKEWLEEAQEDLTYRTLERYGWVFLGAPKPRNGVPLLKFLDDTPVWEVTRDQIKEWYHLPVFLGTVREKRPSASVMKNKHAAFQLLAEWLDVTYDLKVNRRVLKYKPIQEEDEDGIEAGWDTEVKPRPVADEMWRAFWSSKLDPDDRVWLGQAYFLGMRVMEIADLRPRNVDVEKMTMRFKRKGQKYANLNHGQVINGDLRPHLPYLGPFDEWLDLFHDRVLSRADVTFVSKFTNGQQYRNRNDNAKAWRPAPRDLNWFNKQLSRLLRDAGLPRDAFTPHQLRHSCGTNLWRAGTSRTRIVSIMNHASFETTRGYAEVSPEFDEQRLKNQRIRGDQHDWDD